MPTLPYELRQVVQRYPVTLYTRDDCQPCDAGRSLLTTRGVPFAERTVKTNQDNEALQRLTGQNSLPLLTIGSQQVKGFLDSEWTQYLDAAGYPSSSRLPSGYRVPPATPLVAQVPAAPAAAPARPAPAQPAVPPAAAQRADGGQSGRHQVLARIGLQSKRSVSTPEGVPSRHTLARCSANTPTVTTPGHWLTSVSKA